MSEPSILISKICSDEKHGTWYAIGTSRGWLEIRITPSGFVRVGDWNKGRHPYFTPSGGPKND